MATRRHARNARLMVSVTSGGSAEPLPFVGSWTFEAATDKVDATAQGDTSKVYLAGLPDSKGTFSGFFDVDGPQTYTAAVDGLARKTYMYPDFQNNAGTYWFGTAFFDFSGEFGVSDAAKMSGSWSAGTPFQKVQA